MKDRGRLAAVQEAAAVADDSDEDTDSDHAEAGSMVVEPPGPDSLDALMDGAEVEPTEDDGGEKPEPVSLRSAEPRGTDEQPEVLTDDEAMKMFYEECDKEDKMNLMKMQAMQPEKKPAESLGFACASEEPLLEGAVAEPAMQPLDDRQRGPMSGSDDSEDEVVCMTPVVAEDQYQSTLKMQLQAIMDKLDAKRMILPYTSSLYGDLWQRLEEQQLKLLLEF